MSIKWWYWPPLIPDASVSRERTLYTGIPLTDIPDGPGKEMAMKTFIVKNNTNLTFKKDSYPETRYVGYDRKQNTVALLHPDYTFEEGSKTRFGVPGSDDKSLIFLENVGGLRQWCFLYDGPAIKIEGETIKLVFTRDETS